MKKLIALLLVAAAAQPLVAQIYNSCDRWGNITTNGHTVYNNIWGDGYGTQCLTVNSYGNWFVDANHWNAGGIKSYPNVERKVNYNVDSMPALSSSFSVSRPSGGSYNTAYDIWYNNYDYEIMLWMNWNGGMKPIAYNWDASGNPIPDARNVSVGGHTWNVYRGSNGANHVFSFLRTSPTNSATVDITAISKWLRNNGWFGNVNLHSIQFGWEITQTSGNQRFSVTNFSVTEGGGGGGGGGGGSFWRLRNRGTNLYVDGLGRTSNGSNLGQYANTNSQNAHWAEEWSGSYVKFRNRSTNLYIDGMNRTANGSACGQWSSSSSYNQQWSQENLSGGYYKFRNRGTGLYLDGMGRTTNGSDVGQYAGGGSFNQQFFKVTP
jgi:hypothetical protein